MPNKEGKSVRITRSSMHTCVRQCIFDQYVRLIVCFSFHYFRILLAKILQSLTGVQSWREDWRPVSASSIFADSER